jgi:hypothetical protein
MFLTLKFQRNTLKMKVDVEINFESNRRCVAGVIQEIKFCVIPIKRERIQSYLYELNYSN